MYEATDIVKNLEYVDKNDRELIRYQLYVAIQSNSKKKIDVTDVLSLPWDRKQIAKKLKYDADEDKKLEEQAKIYEQMIASGQIKFNS